MATEANQERSCCKRSLAVESLHFIFLSIRVGIVTRGTGKERAVITIVSIITHTTLDLFGLQVEKRESSPRACVYATKPFQYTLNAHPNSETMVLLDHIKIPGELIVWRGTVCISCGIAITCGTSGKLGHA